MAEKAVYQIKRYNEKYNLFETIVKEGGKAAQEIPSGKKSSSLKERWKSTLDPQ